VGLAANYTMTKKYGTLLNGAAKKMADTNAAYRSRVGVPVAAATPGVEYVKYYADEQREANAEYGETPLREIAHKLKRGER
jgi:hypothetical protein